jgi:hypothetical protein
MTHDSARRSLERTEAYCGQGKTMKEKKTWPYAKTPPHLGPMILTKFFKIAMLHLVLDRQYIYI